MANERGGHGPPCDGPHLPDAHGVYRPTAEGCPEGGPPMDLARVIWACGCHCTHEEDAPAVYVRAPEVRDALRDLVEACERAGARLSALPAARALLDTLATEEASE